jgi:hypothetical protein
LSAPYDSGDRLWWCETAGEGQVAVYSATVRDVTETDENTWTVGTDRGQTMVNSQGDGRAGVQVGLLEEDVAQDLDMRGEGYIVESAATEPDYDWHLDIDMDRDGYGYGR